jgi:hypothetical protein
MSFSLQPWITTLLEEKLRVFHDTLSLRYQPGDVVEVDQYRCTSSCLSIHLREAKVLQIVNVSNKFSDILCF